MLCQTRRPQSQRRRKRCMCTTWPSDRAKMVRSCRIRLARAATAAASAYPNPRRLHGALADGARRMLAVTQR